MFEVDLTLPLVLPPILFALFSAVYATCSPKFETDRQRAYILSALSSGCMTLLSLPYLISYALYGLEYTLNQAQKGWMAAAGRAGVVFFGTYLFADLAIGYLKYPSQIGLLTGWIHHVVYIGLMGYLLDSRLSPIFSIGCILELPTFDLAMSNLFPWARNDLRFLVCFFAFRILFHAAFLLDCARPSSRLVTDGSWVPTVVLSLAFALHALWFKGGVAGYLRRSRSKSRVDHAPSSKVADEGDSVLRTVVSAGDEAVLDTLPGTPEDSPLVTPRTPSQTPFQFNIPLPSMPSLSTLPNMPTVSIPSFSLSELKTALNKENLSGSFKDAVKSRWEERRGAFGVGMGYGLGGRGGRGRGGIQQEEEETVIVSGVTVD